jgi:hypothetical protein
MSNEHLSAADAAQPPESRQRAQYSVHSWKLDDMKPNRFNASLFPDSLSDASIALIADDLSQNGQRVPVAVTSDGTIVDGERRWRGAHQLGWETMEVVVDGELSDDQLLERVVASCTSSRQMTVREQVNVYAAVCEQLRREAGRQQGRPEKTIPKGILYLTPKDIHDAAAKRAGFSSTALALRAEAIFTRGPEDLQARVREGSVAITAAYEELPKRPKAKMIPDSSESGLVPDGDDGGPTKLIDIGGGSTEPPKPPTTPGADSGLASAGSEAPASSAAGNAITCDDEEDLERDGEEEEDDTSREFLPSADGDPPSVGDHVNAICRHVAELAGRDYDDAAAWLEQVIEEMRLAVGERPDGDDDVEPPDPFEEYFEGR